MGPGLPGCTGGPVHEPWPEKVKRTREKWIKMVEILGKSLVSMKSLMNVRWEHHDECLLPAVFF